MAHLLPHIFIDDAAVLVRQPDIVAAAKLFLAKKWGAPLRRVATEFDAAAQATGLNNIAFAYNRLSAGIVTDLAKSGVDLYEALTAKRDFMLACEHPLNGDLDFTEKYLAHADFSSHDAVEQAHQMVSHGAGKWIDGDDAENLLAHIYAQRQRYKDIRDTREEPQIPNAPVTCIQAFDAINARTLTVGWHVKAMTLHEMRVELGGYARIYGHGAKPLFDVQGMEDFSSRADFCEFLETRIARVQDHTDGHVRINNERKSPGAAPYAFPFQMV